MPDGVVDFQQMIGWPQCAATQSGKADFTSCKFATCSIAIASSNSVANSVTQISLSPLLSHRFARLELFEQGISNSGCAGITPHPEMSDANIIMSLDSLAAQCTAITMRCNVPAGQCPNISSVKVPFSSLSIMTLSSLHLSLHLQSMIST